MIKINDYLRREVKLLHALQDIRYKEIAEYLEIKSDSLLKWLHGYYNLSVEKLERLDEIVANLKIGDF